MRSVRVLILLAALAGVAFSGAVIGSLGAQEPPPASALGRLADCVSANRRLAMVVLVDESGSLRTTDVFAGRVDAAKAAVAGLAGLVDRSGGQVSVDAQVAGFGVDFEAGAPWQRVDGAGRGAVDARIDEFRNRNSGLDTDYVNALQGALESVQRRAREMQQGAAEPTCTAVMWFTDGSYDVEDRLDEGARALGRDNRGESQNKAYAPDADLYRSGGNEEAERIGRTVLCNPGGVADQYRATNTPLLGVALTTSISEGDRNFLTELVTTGGPNCGIGAGGELLQAADVGGLAPLFDRIVADLGDPSRVEPLCGDVPTCPTGAKTFVVDGLLSRFHVLGQLNAIPGGRPEVEVRLTPPGPGSAPVVIPPRPATTGSGSDRRGSTEINWSWISDRALTIDAVAGVPPENWVGEWTVEFIALPGTPAEVVSDVTVFLYGEFSPRMTEGTAFRAGEPNEFTVELVRSDGEPIRPSSLVAPVTVTAQVITPTCIVGSSPVPAPCTGPTPAEQELEVTAEGWAGTFEPTEELAAVPLQVRLAVETAVPGEVPVELAETTVTVPVLPPLVFPTVRPQFLDIGPIEGTDTFRASLTVEGSDLADGCVWLVGYEPAPGAIEELQVVVDGGGSTSDECLRVPKDGEIPFTVGFTPADEARGFTTGTLRVASRSDNGPDIREVPVDVQVELVKPASVGVAWAIFAALFLLGVGLPLLAFYLSNWWVARFAPLRLLQACSVRVAVSDIGVDREEPIASGRLLDPNDFSNHYFGSAANSGDRPREFTWSDGDDAVPFRARVSRNPLRPPFGTAGDGKRPVIGSGRGNALGLRGRVPLWVTREWVFLPDPVDDGDDPVTGTLVAFVLATDRATAVPLLEGQLADRLPAVAELCRKVRTVRDRPATVSGGPGVDPISGLTHERPFDWGDSTAGGTITAPPASATKRTSGSPAPPPWEAAGTTPTPPSSGAGSDEPDWGDTPPRT